LNVLGKGGGAINTKGILPDIVVIAVALSTKDNHAISSILIEKERRMEMAT